MKAFRLAVAVAALFLAAAVSSAGAQAARSLWAGGGGPHIGVDALVGTPSSQADVFRKGFVGASLRYMASRNLEFSLDYAFMDFEYYYPESSSGPWTGPVPWSSVPATFSSMKDSWIFYQTRHFLAPQVWYVAPLEDYGLPMAIRLGAGPALSFVVPNEAAQYYPGLSDAFDQFASNFKAYLGLSLRLGLELRPLTWGRVGLEYLFVVDSLIDMAAELGHYGLDYAGRAGNFVVYAGLRL